MPLFQPFGKAVAHFVHVHGYDEERDLHPGQSDGTAKLRDLRVLLDAVIADEAERAAIAKQSCDVLTRIRDYQDVERSLLAADSVIPTNPRINQVLPSLPRRDAAAERSGVLLFEAN